MASRLCSGRVFLRLAMDTCDEQHIHPFKAAVAIRKETADPVELPGGISEVPVYCLPTFSEA
ncbi:hypothetical protein EGR_11129 [Echinococcus granulosus]|uniref:Uncharacterized protein n=1 Tax=Echinococcus granulosus TaxID=6210 RepID=W6U0Q3_ECHGR|nr:hypothetical protein EGR_11129 [Echinococcus granulosus]EUB54016.1 hypothetical protein EGR_11129 [Echinococcus granulosus]